MNKFYVYAMTTDAPDERSCIYVDVESIELFALHQFQPHSMEYSGVMVEADNAQDAHEVYNTFGDGAIIWTDEPIFTVKKRQAFEAKTSLMKSKLSTLADALGHAEEAAMKLAIHACAKGISIDLIKMNEHISRMADLVRQTSEDSPEVTSQELYERLKQRYIEQLTRYDYDDGSGPGGKVTG